MSKSFLRRIFLLFLLLFSSNRVLPTVNWNPDITPLTSTNSVFNEDLEIFGDGSMTDTDITVSEDVYIVASTSDITVSVTSNNISLNTVDGAYTWGHIIFYADAGKKINVNCDFDLTFETFNPGYPHDFIVTFSGQGQTIFNLGDYNAAIGTRGAQVRLDGYQNYGYAFPGESITDIDHQNCRAYILMDQTEDQAITNGINKVVFKRKSGGTHPDFPVGLHIGDGAFLTFLSKNPTGYSKDPAASGDFGSIAFDPTYSDTHDGKGLMYLDIDSRDIEFPPYPAHIRGIFSDGGISVLGHYVPSWDEVDIRQRATLNSVAGRKALFRVIDDSRYDGENKNPTDDQARGLMIINRNTTIPKFAADPYGEDNLSGATNSDSTHPNTPHYWSYDYSWRYAPRSDISGCTYYYTGVNDSSQVDMNVQTGFVLGKNGRIEIAHQTFMDYVATLTDSKMDQMLADDYSTYRQGDVSAERLSSPVFKNNNPSALFIDGLFEDWRVNAVNSAYKYDPSASGELDPDAEIFLYGNAKLLLRAGSKATCDSDHNRPIATRVENGDYIYTFTIDSATYDGQYASSSQVTDNEGKHVLDIEAPLIVRSFSRNDYASRSYTGGTDLGQINLPTVTIDHTGREFDYVSDAYINRPLTKNSTYKIFDSPSILMNASVQLYNTVLNNSDITKPLSTSSDAALPNIVGGEVKLFNSTLYPNSATLPVFKELYQSPRLELYNSRLDLHEHFVGAGIKFVTRELSVDKDGVELTGSDANNESTLIFYNHLNSSGMDIDTLDHGFGRLFMAASSNNKMSNGISYPDLENCSINVYRQTTNNDDPAQIIKLSLATGQDSDSPVLTYLANSTDIQTPHHLILLNRSTNGAGLIDLGWTTTVGDDQSYPWENLSGVGSNYFDINVTTSGDPNVLTTKTPPATLSIDGNYFYFGGFDDSGNKAIVPVISATQGSVIYVNHGGRITATQPDITSHGYDAFIDLPIAYRLWSYDGLRGIVDLPKDQVMYGNGFGRQPYNINTVTQDAGSAIGTHLNIYNGSKVQGYEGRTAADRHSGEEYILCWSNRTDENTPVKNLTFKNMLTRFTGIIDEPVSMPDDIVYFGAGDGWSDIVTQLKVSGATLADPLHLLIDGYSSGPGYAWVKEIISQSSTPEVYGEGPHGIIFLRNGGRLGIGNNSWNDQSLSSWKLLGKDYLTISPAGNGTVDLNSDVFVINRGAFVAESSFGKTEVNRLTINLNGNDLYVPAGHELDLSSFGQNAHRQEIEFAGEGRVILGHGAIIRFPKTITPLTITDAPVLYFNDNTRLVIEDDPEFGKGKYTTLEAADEDKVKIFGYGQVWLNKDAHFEIMGGSKVRVGSDENTPVTDFILSIQRQGDFLIGDEQERGGSFEVGNLDVVTGLALEEGAVNFELKLNGIKSRVHLDRGAFMGFGVGVIDKSSDVMNGNSTLSTNPVVNPSTGDVNFSPDTTNAWEVKTLYDVNQIKLTINEGIFDHSNIFNGSDRKAAMLAIGPLFEYNGTPGAYTLELTDPDRSKILGGGNVMLLYPPASLKNDLTTYINAWDFADPKYREEWLSLTPEDYGKYNMLASDMIVQQQAPANFINSTLYYLSGGGIKIVTGSDGPNEFFEFLSTPKYTTLDSKMVNCGMTQFRTFAGFINTPETSTDYSYATGANQIYRLTGISIVGQGRPEDGTEIGVLGSTGSNEPVVYTVVNRR